LPETGSLHEVVAAPKARMISTTLVAYRLDHQAL
jgi:hypothetical protein